jgi:hypothetical protein
VSGPFLQRDKILIAAGNPVETWLQIHDDGPERECWRKSRPGKKAARRQKPERIRNGWPNEPNLCIAAILLSKEADEDACGLPAVTVTLKKNLASRSLQLR